MSAPDWAELSAALSARAWEQSEYLSALPRVPETEAQRQRVEALETALERAAVIAMGLSRPAQSM